MTADELRKHFNETFGLNKWPDRYEAGHETFAEICNAVFEHIIERDGPNLFYTVALGPNGGIMFKAVEIILKR